MKKIILFSPRHVRFVGPGEPSDWAVTPLGLGRPKAQGPNEPTPGLDLGSPSGAAPDRTGEPVWGTSRGNLFYGDFWKFEVPHAQKNIEN